MFSCFKSLNKKFICSICSACLLCMTGVSQLRAEEEPLTLGDTTVESATVGTNAFLANTLQDHVYSSRLLPIFSKKPFLYVIDGKSKLTLDEIPDKNKIPFGKGTSTSVFIAAAPTDDISLDESNESSYDGLTWYQLTDRSWNNLCVRNPGSARILYHVVSTDNNINGTIDDVTTLNVKHSPMKRDILSDNYFNKDTQMLGFSYIIVDKNGNFIQKIAKISMNPNDKGNADFTFDEFLDHLWKTDFLLQKDVYQYDSDGNNLNENLENHTTIYSLCMMMMTFALNTDNDAMLIHVAESMRENAISYKNKNGNVANGDNEMQPLTSTPVSNYSDAITVFQAAITGDEDIEDNESILPETKRSLPKLFTTNNEEITAFSSSTKEIRLHCPQVDSLSSVLVNNNWLPLNIDKESEFIDNITSFVSEFAGSNDFNSGYKRDNLRGYVSASGTKVQEDQYKIEPTLFNYCLAARRFAMQNNKQNIVKAIDQLERRYKISADKPNGMKP